ncbi:hypothetical protein TNCV_519931 [Trichonephila clavipes]|nr:hypothetical protein TNCV_519931 [Trichonephila clavipes]
MVRKKQKNIFERHRNSNATSCTSHEGSQSTATPEPTCDDVMDLFLLASPQASRPKTPQDFDATSSKCQDLLRAATEVKALAPSIELVHSQISNLITQGQTDPDDPAILVKSQLLERLNGYYQQAVSLITSFPPCDIPNCTRHTPTNTPVKDDQTESPLPKPTSTKRKENNNGFISPPLKKLNKNLDTTTDTETTFTIDLTNKFNALVMGGRRSLKLQL